MNPVLHVLHLVVDKHYWQLETHEIGVGWQIMLDVEGSAGEGVRV